MKLSAIYSRSYDKGSQFVSQFEGCKVYTNILDLANDSNIDAVYIASPNCLHYEQSKFQHCQIGNHKIATSCIMDWIDSINNDSVNV